MIYFGTAGFSYKDWEGIVYPPDLKKRKIHQLEYLARFFDCCEINTTFYGHLNPAYGKRWCEMVNSANPGFVFTAKLNKAFTHAPSAMIQSTSAETIVPTGEDETLAKEGLDSIACSGKLGALLIQFPISFKNTDANRAYLQRLLERFREYPRVVEIRHSSWDDPDLLSGLIDAGVGLCNIDQPLLGKAIRPSAHVTAPVGYVRLHGRNYKEWFESDNRNDRYNYLYRPKELEGWAEKIRTIDAKAEKTFVVANNHYKGQAAVNALELKSMLNHTKVLAPETLVQHYPELVDLARN